MELTSMVSQSWTDDLEIKEAVYISVTASFNCLVVYLLRTRKAFCWYKCIAVYFFIKGQALFNGTIKDAVF